MNSFVFEIAKRLRQPNKQDSYISFVSASSTAGIGLGCAVLILLLSVMNGFEYELRNTLLSIVPHAEIFSINDRGLYPEKEFIDLLENDPKVDAVFLLNKASGLLQTGKKMKAVSVIGIDREYFMQKLIRMNNDEALFDQLSQVENGLLLGKTIIQDQGISVGDQIQLLLPSSTQNLSFAAPKSAWLEVVGELSAGGELNNQLGVVNNQYLATLLGFSDKVTHIEIKLKDPFDAHELVRKYGFNFSQAAFMSDWTRTNGHLYQDIQLIRTVVYIVLALVIAVACFNIVSALVMSVKEKSKEIAILKTIGATNTDIGSIFILKGLYHGLKGALVGTVVGVLLALYLPEIITLIEVVLGTQVFSGDIYFTGSIPSKLDWLDVVITVSLVIVISTIATLYPAKQAANVEPTANLH
ncbi:lipoprotein-releasing system transmembrane protein lolE [Glaciecola punicea ACAM 611]|jgi:lipoprotein-releasing system permease protein|uniref:Lipoprotein-releasing system transmembrane protein lolE n=1 Tax=Glaciecola punicea ACAM 611 TaxID=1121923 RepID=H5T9E4_9ALTE|nr:lipoprotein-releasing ABC transporter permease subunit [Glaciecola punicea]GAB54921.1 lipoprotein-releasing system transmembrane protein lolE [Glaciecola punicea ACAM 611]